MADTVEMASLDKEVNRECVGGEERGELVKQDTGIISNRFVIKLSNCVGTGLIVRTNICIHCFCIACTCSI